MLQAFLRALASLTDRRLLPIWLKSLAATALVFAVFGIGVWHAIVRLIDDNAYLAGLEPGQTMALAWLAVFLVGWLLWRIIALAVLQFFADEVVLAVESRHYPEMAAAARQLGWREEAGRALSGAGRALLFNLLALPVASSSVSNT